jgi:hypothetical protein
LDTDPERADNPVADFLADRSRGILRFENDLNTRKIRALLGEVTINLGLLDLSLEQAQDETAIVSGISCAALDHLTATQYVNSSTLMVQALGMRSYLSTVMDRLQPQRSKGSERPSLASNGTSGWWRPLCKQAIRLNS